MTFEELIKTKGLKAKDIAQMRSVTIKTVYNWISGKTEPKASDWKAIENYTTD